MAAYGSDESMESWLEEMGLTLPSDAAPLAVLRSIGSMFVDGAYGSRFCGTVAEPDQDLEWPRVGAYRGSRPLPSDLTPKQIEQAAYFAGYYGANNPEAFFGGGVGAELVKRETVGPLTTEYAVSANMTPDQLAAFMQVQLPYVEGLLSPFLCDKNGSATFILSIGP